MALNPDWTGRELIWQKIPDVSRAREIVIDGETWVRLRRVRRFGSLATVESKAGEWTLKRVGLFRTRITIRVADQELNLALFTPSFAWFGSAGTLEFSEGRVCHWAPTKSFGREHSFWTPDHQLLLSFRGGPSKCRMTFGPASDEPYLPLIAALGYYLIQLSSEDSVLA